MGVAAGDEKVDETLADLSDSSLRPSNLVGELVQYLNDRPL